MNALEFVSPVQQREIIQTIKQHRLNPLEFVAKDIPFHHTVQHSKTGLKFTWEMHKQDPNLFMYGFSRLNSEKTFYKEQGNWFEFHTVLKEFENWLETVIHKYKSNYEITNPWDELILEGLNFSQVENEDTLITSADKVVLNSALDDVERLINQKFTLTEEQNKYVNQELGYLRKLLEKLDKKGWQIIAKDILIELGKELGKFLVINLAFGLFPNPTVQEFGITFKLILFEAFKLWPLLSPSIPSI